MLKKLIAGWKLAFGLHFPGRNLRIFPDDTFFVSYPKSGNTWVRFLVANLAYAGKNPDFCNIDTLVPDPEAMSKRSLERAARPRILKSHECFDPRFPRVLYVVRDPRDVVLSEYHFDIKRRVIADDCPLPQFVSRFVTGPMNHPHGTWGEHVASWFYTRGNDPRLLLVKYELLQSQPVEEMRKVAEFLGIAASDRQLQFAVEQSSAQRMRELEKEQGHLWASTRETRQDRPFVRSAKAGGWRSELPEASVAEIESKWGTLMSDLGYELAISSLVHARLGER
jgi:hypothetical protein